MNSSARYIFVISNNFMFCRLIIDFNSSNLHMLFCFLLCNNLFLSFQIFSILGSPNEKIWPGIKNLSGEIVNFPKKP
jgi:hypothetical protein